MKRKGTILITVAILGAAFVCTFDIIAGKPVNDITGPKSVIALAVCALLAMLGIRFLLKGSKR